MKKILISLFMFLFLISNVQGEEITKFSNSAILMEMSTGKIIYELEPNKKSPPASMTKIMSMILIMDAVNSGVMSLNDDVTVSENASSMGGSQVFLNPGESYKASELLKSVAIASANDAVVALAEKSYGSVEKFVTRMNEKCKELGCKNTVFKNPHGLDDEGHFSSAYDMALMAKYLLTNYEEILDYTSIYEDYLKRPDGSQTWLVNTNKLVRFYDDVDGLKTGFTDKAGYCLTATAKKNDMRLISVIMGVDTTDNRTSDTVKLLNYGFNSYKIETIYKTKKVIGKLRIENGKKDYVDVVLKSNATELLNINDPKKTYTINIELDKIKAPVKKGDVVGSAEIIDNEGNIVDIEDLTIKEDVLKANYFDYVKRNLNELFVGKNVICL